MKIINNLPKLTNMGDIENSIQNLESSKAPVGHASEETTYGIGTNSNYGHVKLSDSYTDNADASSGMAASPKAISDAYTGLNTALNTEVTRAKAAETQALTDAKSYTDTKFDSIVGEGASTTLDTIGEISKAIEEHQDVTDALNSAIGNKVDKISGKGLSTNDYTDAEQTKLEATNIAYGTCTTAAATAAKVITISGNTNWKLKVGAIIIVKFNYSNTASNPTFNVNNTGAKSIWYNTDLITTSNLGGAGIANRPTVYAYDGTQFVWIGQSMDNNTTYTNASLGQGYGTCATAAATTAKVVTLSSYALVTGGIVAVKFTYAVPASATMNINSKGAKAIYHKGAAIAAGVINDGDTATFVYNGSQYHLLTVDRDVDTNTDTKATQTNTTTTADYRVILSTNANDTTETGTLCKSANFTANPSTGAFYAKGYDRIDITGATLDINTLTLSAGSPEIMKYIEKTSGGAGNITNIPVAGQPFILDVELIRWAGTSDYITKHTFVSIGAKTNEYVRYCTSGTWDTSWTKRVFTDNNTKNTAGSTDSSSKLFLIGATSQAANPQTYSQDTAYVDTNGHLYSNSKQTVNLSDTQALTNKTYNGYTLADACGKGVLNLTAKGSLSYNASTAQTLVPTVSTLVYWNGRYNSTSSNLEYCNKGAFGDAAIKGVDTTATNGSANLITSGAMYTALAGKSNSSHTHKYAASSSAGGAATKVYGTLTNPTGATEYAIPFHSGASSADKTLLNNNGIKYKSLEGTASANGYGLLILGNSTASGTAANKYGCILAYGTGAYYTQLSFGKQTANRTITFPDATGTVALTGHTHSYLPLSGGTLKGHVGVDTDNKYIIGGASKALLSVYSYNIVSPGNLYMKTDGSSTGVYVQSTQSIGLRCVLNSGSGWVPVYASAFNVSSSKRFKENIIDITEDEAKKILEINTYHFDYINGSKNQTGCIAEEIQEIYPEICAYDIDEETKETQVSALDYSKFIPYLIKMIQIQQNEIEILKKS